MHTLHNWTNFIMWIPHSNQLEKTSLVHNITHTNTADPNYQYIFCLVHAIATASVIPMPQMMYYMVACGITHWGAGWPLIWCHEKIQCQQSVYQQKRQWHTNYFNIWMLHLVICLCKMAWNINFCFLQIFCFLLYSRYIT